MNGAPLHHNPLYLTILSASPDQDSASHATMDGPMNEF